ncbi:MAG: rod shape-determining protein MreC [Treponema sp.]|nr:rod shape-determining protein MreC [Treponema sp.]
MWIEQKKKSKKNLFNTTIGVFFILVVVSFAVLSFSTRNFSAGIKNAGLSLFSGIRGGIYGVTSFISRTALSIRELSILRKEYNELTDRMSSYEQLERSVADVRQENNRLREQLGFSQSLLYRHIPAELIGRDPDNLFSAFVINKGSYSGVAIGMPVIAYQNGAQSLVGKVIQAGVFESLVMPLYDSSSYVSSRLAQSRYEGITEGRGSPDSPLLMRFIPKQAREEINPGDMVITSGLGGVFPEGINIGRVSGIRYQETEISMELELEMSIDFSRLEYVFVIDAASGQTAGPTDLQSAPQTTGQSAPQTGKTDG